MSLYVFQLRIRQIPTVRIVNQNVNIMYSNYFFLYPVSYYLYAMFYYAHVGVVIYYIVCTIAL